MARYIDPSCRQCRRIGEKLFLKGTRCYTPKCAVERRKRTPGPHQPKRRRTSDWAVQLREKQKAKFTYGILERQFRRYFENARENTGITGEILLQILERRLDNTIYRLSFADSRKQARELVNHGHFTVNGRRVDIPSYLVRPGDVIAWAEVEEGVVPAFIQQLTDGTAKHSVPRWLKIDAAALKGEVLSLPDVSENDTGIEPRLIVESYNR
ncbi:MAG: 30S ribosomal protein S4 [SAR202 cluster bacterium]|nr:30S ribosomal protein S4 [SAR202 cluster bacterium]